MKTAKRLLAALLAAGMALALAACNKGGLDIPLSQGGDGDFQKNMHQLEKELNGISYLCETDTGFYFERKLLYYLDKEKKQVTAVCGKPDCDHKGADCNARIGPDNLWAMGDKLYFIRNDYQMVNGRDVNQGKRVFSVNMDATGLKRVQELDFEPDGDTSIVRSDPIFHRGYVYFIYSYTLYAAPLGADLKEARTVYAPELPEGQQTGGLVQLTGNEPSYTLWGDGDYMYFMVNAKQPDGTYRDTLFSYDPEAGETQRLWVVPTAGEVGHWGWEKYGVVNQWYVTDGTVYFFLAGNGLWRYDLADGAYEKLADTTDRAEYGKAVFSDDYMLLIDDGPEIRDGAYTGEDALFVYKLDGTFVKELSLKGITDTASVYAIKMLFNAGNIFCFVADAGTKTAGESGSMGGVDFAVTGKITHDILCWLDLETGELTRLTEFTD